MSSEHYFSGSPASAERRRRIDAVIAGRDVTLETAGGVFSPDHVDAGTAALLGAVPPPPTSGHLLDVGCGWGPIALTMAELSPDATVWAVDVNERALDLTRRNAAALGIETINAVRPEEVPEDIAFDAIWSNPPIRVGKDELHGILRTWLPRLADDADAWLVVHKNLGSDSLQRWLAAELPDPRLRVSRATSIRGFRVLRVRG